MQRSDTGIQQPRGQLSKHRDTVYMLATHKFQPSCHADQPTHQQQQDLQRHQNREHRHQQRNRSETGSTRIRRRSSRRRLEAHAAALAAAGEPLRAAPQKPGAESCKDAQTTRATTRWSWQEVRTPHTRRVKCRNGTHAESGAEMEQEQLGTRAAHHAEQRRPPTTGEQRVSGSQPPLGVRLQ